MKTIYDLERDVHALLASRPKLDADRGEGMMCFLENVGSFTLGSLVFYF